MMARALFDSSNWCLRWSSCALLNPVIVLASSVVVVGAFPLMIPVAIPVTIPVSSRLGVKRVDSLAFDPLGSFS